MDTPGLTVDETRGRRFKAGTIVRAMILLETGTSACVSYVPYTPLPMFVWQSRSSKHKTDWKTDSIPIGIRNRGPVTPVYMVPGRKLYSSYIFHLQLPSHVEQHQLSKLKPRREKSAGVGDTEHAHRHSV